MTRLSLDIFCLFVHLIFIVFDKALVRAGFSPLVHNMLRWNQNDFGLSLMGNPSRGPLLALGDVRLEIWKTMHTACGVHRIALAALSRLVEAARRI